MAATVDGVTVGIVRNESFDVAMSGLTSTAVFLAVPEVPFGAARFTSGSGRNKELDIRRSFFSNGNKSRLMSRSLPDFPDGLVVAIFALIESRKHITPVGSL